MDLPWTAQSRGGLPGLDLVSWLDLHSPQAYYLATTLPTLFTPDTLLRLFPRDRANEFFEALFGDADEGAYDIELGYRGLQGNELVMELRLHERPGRCLACNLTQGLPQVFSGLPLDPKFKTLNVLVFQLSGTQGHVELDHAVSMGALGWVT